MNGNQAYGQTDVMHDPNYLRSLLTHTNPHVRDQAREALKQLEVDQTQAEHQQMFEETRKQREDIHTENLQARQDYQAGLKSDREGRAAVLKQSADTARAQQLQQMASDPNFDKATREVYKAELNKILGINIPTASATKGKLDYGPSGAPAGAAGTAPAPAQVTSPSYTQPTDAFKTDVATGVGSGAASPESFDLYAQGHSVINPNGTRTTTLPSGGTATYFDRTTPQGRAAIGAPHDIPRPTGDMVENVPIMAPSGVMSARRDIPIPSAPSPFVANPPPKEAPLPGGGAPGSGGPVEPTISYQNPTAAFTAPSPTAAPTPLIPGVQEAPLPGSALSRGIPAITSALAPPTGAPVEQPLPGSVLGRAFPGSELARLLGGTKPPPVAVVPPPPKKEQTY